MRINQFVATASGMSRRAADRSIIAGQVHINGQAAIVGQLVNKGDVVKLNGLLLVLPQETTTIIMNKPVGYVCSRNGQGSKTIYDLLPEKFHNLKSVGRLDKDSSGLLLMTDDGQLANNLTHPRFAKQKVYNALIDKPLQQTDQIKIEQGIGLEDGPSSLQLRHLENDRTWEITMYEGRNRQIRRTFAKLGYDIVGLKRLTFGDYRLDDLADGTFKKV